MKVFGSPINWIPNFEPSNIIEADIVVLPGGADINPVLYGEEPIDRYPRIYHDDHDLRVANYALRHNKMIIGICRGAQLLNVLNGGKLVQDVGGHHSHHAITDVLGTTVVVPSLHHQMMIPTDGAEIFAWSSDIISPYHTTQEGEITMDKEPEIIIYDKTKSLCIQSHPEFSSGKALEYFQQLTLDLYEKW